MTEVTRSREEIEQRLVRLGEYEPVSKADRQANRAATRQLEWVLSPDEAADEER